MHQDYGRLEGVNGVTLRYASWRPEGKPRAAIVLVHGYGEHMGRYLHVIAALVEQGYAVVAVDHQGHGLSEGKRASIRDFTTFVDDLDKVVDVARDAFPELPLIMYGQSMGGLLATLYTVEHQSRVDALIATSPAYVIDDGASRLLVAVGRLLSKVAPDFKLVEGEEGVLSRDPEIQRLFEADPLTYNDPTRARMAAEMLDAGARARESAARLTIPLLLMHGTADRLTFPRGTKTVYERAASEDRTLKLWEGAYHELHNELNKEEVIDYIIDWIESRLPTLARTHASRVPA